MAQYSFIHGFRAPQGASAEKIAQELQSASVSDVLTPDMLVEYAANPKTHVHRCFTWDNDAAAHQYRLQQARMLIRSVQIVYEERPAEPQRVFTLVTVEHGNAKQGYMPTEIIVTKPDLFSDALRRLKAEATAALRSVKELERLAPAHKAKALQRAARDLGRAADSIGRI
jgi:hypothetical protein